MSDYARDLTKRELVALVFAHAVGATLLYDEEYGTLNVFEVLSFPDEVDPVTCLRRWTVPQAVADARYKRFFAVSAVVWDLHVREVQNPRKGFEVRWGGVGAPWTPLNLVLPFDRVLHHDLTATADLDRFAVSAFPWEGSSASTWRCLCSPRCSRADGGRGETVDAGHACFVCGAQEGSKQWVW